MATQGASSASADSGVVPANRRRLEDRYRSLYPIGRGGMGVVEVALEVGAGRVVALKRLLPEGKRDKRHSEMFLREARLAARLSHPNVVHAFDYGEEDDELFLAMEYIEGEPLSRVLAASRERGGGLDPALAAYVLAEISDGLHAAHELVDERGARLNVVHRDVSPHNVMVAYDGQVKLLDFGVAKIEAEGGLTKTGEVKGKVAYMSPEQAMGDVLDRRSDIYSLGACLFECLTGRRMWEGTDMEVLRHLALDLPPRLESVAPYAPIELCRLYDRLVAREVNVRPATAAEVAGELRAYAARASRRADPQVIAAMMHRLFASDLERRRAQMEDALRAVVEPTDADAIRRSFAPAPSSSPEATAPQAVVSVITSAAGVPKKRSGGATAFVVVALLLAAAGSAFYVTRVMKRPIGAASAAGDAVTPQGAGGVGSAGAAGATPAESTTAIVPRTNTIEIESKGTAPVRGRPPATSHPPATKPKGSSKAVDVDPNPI